MNDRKVFTQDMLNEERRMASIALGGDGKMLKTIEINEEKVHELINLKLLEWKECSRICSVNFEEIEYYMKENSNEWELISEHAHRIPMSSFEKILEESKFINNQIDCYMSTLSKKDSEVESNSNLVYIEIGMMDYKHIFKITSLKKRN